MQDPRAPLGWPCRSEGFQVLESGNPGLGGQEKDWYLVSLRSGQEHGSPET